MSATHSQTENCADHTKVGTTGKLNSLVLECQPFQTDVSHDKTSEQLIQGRLHTPHCLKNKVPCFPETPQFTKSDQQTPNHGALLYTTCLILPLAAQSSPQSAACLAAMYNRPNFVDYRNILDGLGWRMWMSVILPRTPEVSSLQFYNSGNDQSHFFFLATYPFPFILTFSFPLP